MNYAQLISELKNKWASINKKEYLIWEDFDYSENCWVAVITLPKLLKDKLYVIEKIYNEVEGSKSRTTTSVSELWYTDSLEWLFTYYPHWVDYQSNCILANSQWEIIWISYKGYNTWCYIFSEQIDIPNYIVLNNKKKLEGKYTKEDVDKLSPFLKNLFDNKII